MLSDQVCMVKCIASQSRSRNVQRTSYDQQVSVMMNVTMPFAGKVQHSSVISRILKKQHFSYVCVLAAIVAGPVEDGHASDNCAGSSSRMQK